MPLLLLVAYNARLRGATPDRSPRKLAEIVSLLEKQLGIQIDVQVKVAPNTHMVVSVAPLENVSGTFVLTIDEAFLNQLDDEEMTAAVGHELGHVWIFTHHPFLQTEALANQIAMRVVARDSLKKLYSKLWAFQSTTGNVADLLGPEPAAAHVTNVAKPRH